MEHNKAPGPDGFQFYQACRNFIKGDLMALSSDFHDGSLPLYRLNFGMIILVYKCWETIMIQQYKHIYLLNVSFKIFAKVASNRIAEITKKVISPTQTTFLPGRNIMEGVIILHETIHKIHRKKQSGVILNLDFKKAYDKINLTFVQQALRMKGFSSTWCKWVASFMEGGHVDIKDNDQVGKNFQTRRGVRQEYLLSPILFNIVIDMFAILINRAKHGGQISRVIPNVIDDGLSILQYMDDTILFMDHNLE
jgi:hypothetical protein